MAAYTTIDDPSAYFKVQLYTGDGSTPSITFDDTDTDMQPDIVWIKNRDATDSHCVFDAVRGATEVLHADAITAEATDADTLTSFDSDGFALGADVKVNTNAERYVAWNWKAGTTSGIAGSPSITPLGYSFNATSGFSAIKYEGTGSAGTLPHGLGVAPSMIIVKALETTDNWAVYHKSLGATKYIELNLTAAAGTSAVMWNDTEPTSTLFTVNTNGGVNTAGNDYIAYCFAEKTGYSKFGSWISNNNADGTFVYTGFAPSFVMLKEDDGTNQWVMYDNKRPGYNKTPNALFANATSAEATDLGVDLLSNGYKIRSTNNQNTGNYIYMAFGQSLVGTNNIPATAR